jgi:large subunit ribosomal protein L31
VKPGIHPAWYPETVVTCACGNTFTTGSTQKEIHTDVCSNCHPFFTGEQRIIDTAGQVERFMKRASAKEKIAATRPVGEKKRGKKEERRVDRGHLGEQPTAIPIAPAELPLAIVAEKKEWIAPELPVVEMPAMELPQSEPVAEIRPLMPEPIAPVEIRPTLPIVRVAEPVAVPVTKAAKAVKKPAAKKAPAKKPAAKKKTAPKAKIAKTAKATKPAKKSPAKKPARKSKK